MNKDAVNHILNMNNQIKKAMSEATDALMREQKIYSLTGLSAEKIIELFAQGYTIVEPPIIKELKEKKMDLTDEEMIAMREKKEVKKLIEACDKCSWRVTFYGKDREIVRDALVFYEAHKKKEEED